MVLLIPGAILYFSRSYIVASSHVLFSQFAGFFLFTPDITHWTIFYSLLTSRIWLHPAPSLPHVAPMYRTLSLGVEGSLTYISGGCGLLPLNLDGVLPFDPLTSFSKAMGNIEDFVESKIWPVFSGKGHKEVSICKQGSFSWFLCQVHVVQFGTPILKWIKCLHDFERHIHIWKCITTKQYGRRWAGLPITWE